VGIDEVMRSNVTMADREWASTIWGGEGPGGSWIGVTGGGAIILSEGMPRYGLIPGNPFR
jgi:hypothetical protein